MNFPIEGNENTKRAVGNMLLSNRIPHAILIEGADQKDREHLANYICQAAVCEKDNRPCGDCVSCKVFKSDNHPDVLIINPEKNKKTISVDQIREVIDLAAILPQQSQKKVFIINPADSMTPQAQNALLKILEEPPESVIFILTAQSRTEMLKTVLSRCTLLTLSVSEENSNSNMSDLADEFLKTTKTGNRYELLKMLLPLEKDRQRTLDFYNQLESKVVSNLRKCTSPTLVKRYDLIYSIVGEHKKLLKSNTNLSLLLSSLAVEITER